ncbi:MAG: metallophosphoesterase [Pedobacter sp.]|nr:MAG: metallophosphoesterase [Pedobacter sp.]
MLVNRNILLLLGLLAIFVSSFRPSSNPDLKTETKNRPLKILLISDLNASYGSLTYSDDVKAVINRIGTIKPDLILCGGDMVAGQKASLTESHIKNMWEVFKATIIDPIHQRKIPFGFTLGNHDASPSFSKDRKIAKNFWENEKQNSHLTFVDAENYPFYFSYIKNNVFFISWDASGAKIDSNLYEWMKLQTSLPEARNARMRILLGHLPLYAIVAAKNKSGEVNADPQRALAFFKEHGIDLYISGHQHAYYPAQKAGVKLLNAGCIGDGPRQIIGDDRPAMKTYTLIEIPTKQPLKFTQRSFEPSTNKEVKMDHLPDSVSGFNGVVYRADIMK